MLERKGGREGGKIYNCESERDGSSYEAGSKFRIELNNECDRDREGEIPNVPDSNAKVWTYRQGVCSFLRPSPVSLFSVPPVRYSVLRPS